MVRMRCRDPHSRVVLTRRRQPAPRKNEISAQSVQHHLVLTHRLVDQTQGFDARHHLRTGQVFNQVNADAVAMAG